MVSRALLSLTLLTAIVVTGAVHIAGAQTTCPNANERPATSADLIRMKEAGYPDSYITLGRCWDPTSTYIGEDPAKAKEYLRSIVCKSSSFGGTTADGTIFGVNGSGGLDASFAKCASAFLKAASTQLQGAMPLYNGGVNPVCVREGYRTPEQQEKYAEEYRRGGPIACTKGALCEHPRGVAIDVNTTPDTNYAKLHALAAQFGLVFYLPVNDKVHFIPQKAGCTSGGTTPTPGGSTPTTAAPNPNSFLPRSFFDYPTQAPATAPLTSQVLPALTQFGNLLSQPQVGTTPTYPSYPSYPTTDYPTYTWPTATNTIFVAPTTGTESTTTPKNTTASQQAEHDQVLKYLRDQIENPTSQNTSTSAPVQLNSDIDQTSTSTRTGTSNVTDSIYDTEKPIASTSVMVNPIHVTETFSQNEQTRSSVGSTSSSPLASAQALLISLMTKLRDILLTIVQALLNRTPYGFGAPWKPVATSTPYR